MVLFEEAKALLHLKAGTSLAMAVLIPKQVSPLRGPWGFHCGPSPLISTWDPSPQSPHTTMTIQLSTVINVDSAMTLSQTILPFIASRNHLGWKRPSRLLISRQSENILVGQSDKSTDIRTAEQSHPNSTTSSNEIHVCWFSVDILQQRCG